MANEWKTSTVGDFCPFIYGKALPERSRIPGMFPVISSAGISGSHNEPLVTTGGIVIGRKGTVGSVTLSKSAFWPIDTVFYIADEPQRDLRFTYYLLKTLGLDRMNSDSAVPGLNRDNAHARKIYVPELKEQRAIAHILGTLDDKIELNRKQNETLEAMAQAIFKAWFVDFEPVRAKMEGRWQRGQSLPGLPAHLYDLFPERLVESELGEIPEGWPVGVYSDTVEIIGGGTPKTSVDEYWNGEIPWFSVVDTPASGDVFVVSTEKSITQAGFKNSAVKMIERGVTIISARGTVGNLAIAGRDMTFNQSCYALRGKNGFGSYFIFLSAQYMVEQLKAMAHGSVFSTITRQTFDAIKMVLPPKEVLIQSEKRIANLFEATLGNVSESRTLAQIRDTLLPQLISGELRIQNICAVEKNS